MSRKTLLPALFLLVLIPMLAVYLVPRFTQGGAPASVDAFLDEILYPFSPPPQGEELGARAAPASPIELELVGRWPYGPAYAVAHGVIDGAPYAFLGSGSVVLVVDMANPLDPTVIGEVVTPDGVKGLVLSGSLLLVTDDEAGLRVIDTSEPSAPAEVGFLDIPTALRVAVTGDVALVADAAGLRVINISVPSAPAEVGFLDTPGWASGVAVTGHLALVADGGSGLRVIDIAQPSAPTEVGFLDTPGWANGVAVTGDLALVADTAGLRVINISVPSTPVEVGFLDTPGVAYSAAVIGDLVLVANGDLMRVVDISEPTAPVEVGFMDPPGNAYHVTVSGDLALLAATRKGLRVIDISEPSTPTGGGLLGLEELCPWGGGVWRHSAGGRRLFGIGVDRHLRALRACGDGFSGHSRTGSGRGGVW